MCVWYFGKYTLFTCFWKDSAAPVVCIKIWIQQIGLLNPKPNNSRSGYIKIQKKEAIWLGIRTKFSVNLYNSFLSVLPLRHSLSSPLVTHEKFLPVLWKQLKLPYHVKNASCNWGPPDSVRRSTSASVGYSQGCAGRIPSEGGVIWPCFWMGPGGPRSSVLGETLTCAP